MPDLIDRQRLIESFTGPGGWTVYGKYVPAIVSRINAQPSCPPFQALNKPEPLTLLEIGARIGEPVLVLPVHPGAVPNVGLVYLEHEEQAPRVLWIDQGRVHQLDPRGWAPYLVFDYDAWTRRAETTEKEG